MRNLLALLGAALVVFAVVGWYRGWYQFETTAGAGGQHDVKIEINGPKIEKDLHRGTQKIENALENKVKNLQPGAPPASPALPQAVQLPPPGPVLGAPTSTPPSYAPPAYPQGDTYVLPPTSPSGSTRQAPRPYPN
jgi:hypothetical protein